MFYKGFKVTGVDNDTKLDSGLTSLVEVPVHVNAILINVAAHEGNVIECWIGTKRVVEVYDYVLDTQETTATDLGPFSTNKIVRLPVDMDVPAGQIFKVGIRSGTTKSDIYGAYEYTEI